MKTARVIQTVDPVLNVQTVDPEDEDMPLKVPLRGDVQRSNSVPSYLY